MPIHLVISDEATQDALKEAAREVAKGIGREVIQSALLDSIEAAATKAGFKLFADSWSREKFETQVKESIRLQVHASADRAARGEIALHLEAFLHGKGGVESALSAMLEPIVSAAVKAEIAAMRKSISDVSAMLLIQPKESK